MWWEDSGHLDVDDNQLHFAGRSVHELVKEHGTPAYFYNLDKIVQKYEALQGAIEGSSLNRVEVKYAIKANNNQQVVQTVRECGAGIDATSPNELKLARECGFDDRDIVFTGTSLSNADLEMLAESDVLVNFDSVSSLRRFDAGEGRRVGLRINSGVGLGRSKKTTTGGKEARDSTISENAAAQYSDTVPVKFGIPHDEPDVLNRAFDIVEQNGYELACVHHHVGSGWLEDQALEQEQNYLTALEHTLEVAERAENRGHDVSYLDLGGGYGVPHTEEEEPLDLKRLFNGVAETVADSSVEFDAVFVEPGTYLVSEAGIFATRVNTVESKAGRTFVGVDSGLNSFNSFAHYDYHHEVVNCGRVTADRDTGESVIVAGNNCESGDLFTKARAVPTTIDEGDVLALLNAGAYGAVFRSEFNLRTPAKEVVVK